MFAAISHDTRQITRIEVLISCGYGLRWVAYVQRPYLAHLTHRALSTLYQVINNIWFRHWTTATNEDGALFTSQNEAIQIRTVAGYASQFIRARWMGMYSSGWPKKGVVRGP